MKVIAYYNNYGPTGASLLPSWSVIADSALSNLGKPFYVPENIGEVTVSISPALKICRLGKYIEPRFAHRYYKEFAPAVHFQLPSLMQRFSDSNLPVSPALSFDRSVMAADFRGLDNEFTNLSFQLYINGELREEWSGREMKMSQDDVIYEYSKMNTLKMGDVILPAIGNPVAIKEGDLLEVNCMNCKAFSVKIK